MTSIGIIIQCRDGSVRMKNKSVRPFYKNKSILELIIDRVRHLPFKVVVATTPSSKQVMYICRNTNTPIYVGSEDNVAERLFEAAKANGFSGFFRVCADNPFISLPLMYPLTAWGWHTDYIAFDGCMQRHEGLWMEYVRTEALYRAMLACIGTYDLEHVTTFITRNLWLFHAKILEIPPELNDIQIRLTVDTEAD